MNLMDIFTYTAFTTSSCVGRCGGIVLFGCECNLICKFWGMCCVDVGYCCIVGLLFIGVFNVDGGCF